MSVFFQGLFFCICGACFFGLCARALFGKKEKPTDNSISGAPEGALQFYHFQCPNASGSKLSVRASYQGTPQGGG
ncbi:hypothetical protein J2W42_002236 [Rhizobium tibeticum]|nr:hypothetical protein [Rhizobium tibeticum]